MTRYLSLSGIFSVHIPNNYCVEEGDNLISITDEENGVGAINISAYLIPAGYVFNNNVELSEFISSGVTFTGKLMGRFDTDHYAEREYGVDDCYWKYWVLHRNNKAVFGTYNCGLSDRDIEMSTVIEIIDSIEIIEG